MLGEQRKSTSSDYGYEMHRELDMPPSGGYAELRREIEATIPNAGAETSSAAIGLVVGLLSFWRESPCRTCSIAA